MVRQRTLRSTGAGRHPAIVTRAMLTGAVVLAVTAGLLAAVLLTLLEFPRHHQPPDATEGWSHQKKNEGDPHGA